MSELLGMTSWSLAAAVYFSDLRVLGPKCHSTECCGLVSARVHWAAGPIEVCATCMQRWRRVAEVMGTGIHVEPLEYTPVGLDDYEQRCRLLELV